MKQMRLAACSTTQQGGRRMKWIWSTAFVVVAVSAVASAQSGKEMSEPKKGSNMNMTYTGCVEAVNHGGSFLLILVGGDHQSGPAARRMAAMVSRVAVMESDFATAERGGSRASKG